MYHISGYPNNFVHTYVGITYYTIKNDFSPMWRKTLNFFLYLEMLEDDVVLIFLTFLHPKKYSLILHHEVEKNFFGTFFGVKEILQISILLKVFKYRNKCRLFPLEIGKTWRKVPFCPHHFFEMWRKTK